MELYFSEGADLSDTQVLVGAAVACGLDGESIRARLASDADVAAVEQEANSAKEAGIDGVPCFIFGNLLAVSGAQAPEHLAGAIRRAAAERDSPKIAASAR
jgi:predicted DsbA family dithiol-disulfide isomerase